MLCANFLSNTKQNIILYGLGYYECIVIYYKTVAKLDFLLKHHRSSLFVKHLLNIDHIILVSIVT